MIYLLVKLLMKLPLSMIIKDVSNKDIEEISSLEEKIFGIDAFSTDLLKKLLKNKLLFIKLVDETEKILGFSISIEGVKNRANIINLLIREEYQHQGLGSFLLKRTLKEIKNKNKFKSIILNVKIDNDIAIHLYQKYGFKVIKIIENYYESGASANLMKLKL